MALDKWEKGHGAHLTTMSNMELHFCQICNNVAKMDVARLRHCGCSTVCCVYLYKGWGGRSLREIKGVSRSVYIHIWENGSSWICLQNPRNPFFSHSGWLCACFLNGCIFGRPLTPSPSSAVPPPHPLLLTMMKRLSQGQSAPKAIKDRRVKGLRMRIQQ